MDSSSSEDEDCMFGGLSPAAFKAAAAKEEERRTLPPAVCATPTLERCVLENEVDELSGLVAELEAMKGDGNCNDVSSPLPPPLAFRLACG